MFFFFMYLSKIIYLLLDIIGLISITYFYLLFLLQNDAFYGTGTIALNDKLSLPMQDINNDYEINQLKNDLEFKKLEVNINVK